MYILNIWKKTFKTKMDESGPLSYPPPPPPSAFVHFHCTSLSEKPKWMEIPDILIVNDYDFYRTPWV